MCKGIKRFFKSLAKFLGIYKEVKEPGDVSPKEPNK